MEDVEPEDQQVLLGTEERLGTGNHSIVYRVFKRGHGNCRGRHPFWRGLLAFIWTSLLVWGLARMFHRKVHAYTYFDTHY